MSKTEKFYSQQNIDTNLQKIKHVNDVACLGLGAVAGIMTLESLNGFLFYVIGVLATNATFHMICGQRDASRFFKNPIQEIYLQNLLNNIAGFVMLWCLFYALVKSSF